MKNPITEWRRKKREMQILKMAYMARMMEATMPLKIEIYKEYKKKSE